MVNMATNSDAYGGLGRKRAQSINRRATVFAGGFNTETGEPNKPTKDRKDLKKIEILKIMELRIVGKSRPYELTGEVSENMMIRFLIHFLFVEHNSSSIELFDGEDSIFKLIENQPKENTRSNQSIISSDSKSIRSGIGPKDSISQRMTTMEDNYKANLNGVRIDSFY